MNLFSGGVEESVLHILLSAPNLSTEDLIKRVDRKRGGVTKQGVYRVLRKLKSDGRIIIYKSSVSINSLWIERLRSSIDQKSAPSIFGDLSRIKENEQFIIEGKTLIGTDDLWSEAFINIENTTKAKHPLYLYNPHNWTILLRPETDKIHIDRLHHKERPIFLSVGGRTFLDRETVRIVSQNKIHCSVSSSLKTPNYIAVLGDHILVEKLSKKGSGMIDAIFRKDISIEKAIDEIAAVSKKINAKIVIEKDSSKAKVFKKKIARDFFIPKENRDF